MHGSKKWIKDYRGRIKRSNNRTKLDYYGDLFWWDNWRNAKVPFCPQCKHVAKQVVNDTNNYWKVWREVKDEWLESKGLSWVPWRGKYPKEAQEFDDYMNSHPRIKNLERPWHYHHSNYLCFKHERASQMKDRMWREGYPNAKRNYRWSVKNERRAYRKKVKNIMNRAKYDEEYYDDIPPRTHDWLD